MSRIIFLVDMNAFFISCEATRRPELHGIPAAVAGDPKYRSGIILTANYKARAFGVKTGMTLFEAQKVCPEILLLKPDFSLYTSLSRRVMEILSTYTPVIEQASIDEAWLDMTGTPAVASSPRTAAEKIMAEIKDELGLFCSIGISENKFLAKMASDMKKPLGITELFIKDVPEKLWKLPVSDMYGIGSRSAARLRGIGIMTIGDIAKFGEKPLLGDFGKMGQRIFELANGKDNEPVLARVKDEMKSVGRSTTLSEDVKDVNFACKVILALSEEIGADARRYGKKGKTVQITLRYPDFTNITRQASVSTTNLTSEIAAAGEKLLRKNWTNRPVRLIGISLSGFEGEEPEQLSFFESAEKAGNHREEKLEKAVDDLRERFGKTAVKRASLIDESFRKRKK